MGNAKALHDFQLVGVGNARRRRLRFRLYLQIENSLLFAAEHRADAVRRQFVQRLAEVEIILELLSCCLLACADGGPHPSVRPHLLAQCAFQICLLVKALGQDCARAFKRRSRVRHAFFGIDESRRHDKRIALRLRQQHLGQ